MTTRGQCHPLFLAYLAHFVCSRSLPCSSLGVLWSAINFIAPTTDGGHSHRQAQDLRGGDRQVCSLLEPTLLTTSKSEAPAWRNRRSIVQLHLFCPGRPSLTACADLRSQPYPATSSPLLQSKMHATPERTSKCTVRRESRCQVMSYGRYSAAPLRP